MDMTKIVLEGILKVVDHNEKNPCAGGPAWMAYVGDVPIFGALLDESVFSPFVGKRIRLTIEELNDEKKYIEVLNDEEE